MFQKPYILVINGYHVVLQETSVLLLFGEGWGGGHKRTDMTLAWRKNEG